MARRTSLAALFTGYGLVIFLLVFTAALVLVHGGRILNLGFPFMATVVGGVLSVTRRSVYAAFVWWIWLFTPLVRRLVDYQTTYHNVSPVMVTPLLVTTFAIVALLRRPRFSLQRRMLPFLLLLICLVYALLVGVVNNGALPALFDFLNWVLPVGFAMFLVMNPLEFAEIQAALVFAIISGLLLISLYGLYQFYHIPPWDAYWINASQFTTAGQGYDQQVRLFGPLNSPGPYAVVLMASLVFVLTAKGPLRLAAGAAGFPAFGLALVRSAWGGWLLAALFVVWRVGGKTRLRILAVGFVIALVAVPLTTTGPVADALSKRFATLNNIQQDGSFQARQNLYEHSTVLAFTQPIGEGMGAFGLASKLTTGQPIVLDSGFLLIPMQFGWLGGTLFMWATISLLFRVLTASGQTRDRIAIAGGAVFITLLVENVFSSTFGGVIGISLWTGLALAFGPASAMKNVPQTFATKAGSVKNRRLA